MTSSNDSGTVRFLGDDDRYCIEKALTAGGMGEVYIAIDTKLHRQVALKILKQSLVTSNEMSERFKREIMLCAALNSEHIVNILDSGTTPEGYPFYVMDYLKGQSLGQLLRREKRLSPERAIAIVRQVCMALEIAHSGVVIEGERLRIVHRDLKPDNIFLVPSPHFGERVKLLDFGIAKKLRDNRLEQTNLTQMFIGTLRYASPEQVAVRKDIDERADLYSLGMILYTLLTGTEPFGLIAQGRQISELSWARAHLSQAPKSVRSQPNCESIPPELDAIVLKCLEKLPINRFSSAAELRQALEAVMPLVIKSKEVTIVDSEDQTVDRAITPINPALEAPTVAKAQSIYQTILELPPDPRNAVTEIRPLVPFQDANLINPNEASPTIVQLPEKVNQTIVQTRAIANQTIMQPRSQPDPKQTITQPRSQDNLNQTIMQPRSDNPNQTIMQPRSQNNSNQTIFQEVPSRPNETIFQGTPSQPRSIANQTMFQGVPPLRQAIEPPQKEGVFAFARQWLDRFRRSK
ncbi:serine/threonine protein kinase [Pseudanabaenaceae cyanobacterium LEGE 13415]|nr:serine/threonine protein kinase [Pseudanabaenaceae cyanobacterium LEGE 13415]